MTNIQSLFNNVNINLFVVRRDLTNARIKLNNLETDQSDALTSLCNLEETIEQAIDALKECQSQMSSQQLQKYSA